MTRLIGWQDRMLMPLLGTRGGSAPVASLSPQEWGDLCSRAASHRVAHLLYGRLRRREGIPPAVLEELKPRYLESAAANTHRVHQLGRVLALFKSHGIEVIVLKGAFLAEAAYGNIALRTMCDVDLLVREKDLVRAKAILLDDGFHQAWDAPLETDVLFIHHLAPFSRKGKRTITIELHWQLMVPRVDMADADGPWERALATRVAEVDVYTLCPEDLLLHLCMHACLQHRLAVGITPLLDVDAFLHTFAENLDWEALIARAHLWGAGASVALLLTYAADLFGSRFPDGMLARLAPGGLSPEVIDLADRQFFGERAGTAEVSITITRLNYADSPRAFISIVRERLFPSRAEILLRYRAKSSTWLPVLYLVHPFALLGRHGRSIGRVLMGKSAERAVIEECQRGLAIERALKK